MQKGRKLQARVLFSAFCVEPTAFLSPGSTRTLTALAVPDLLLATLLPALDAGTTRNLFRISGSSFLDVAAFVFSNLRKRSAGKNGSRCYFGDIFFGRVVIPMFYEKPLTISRMNQHPGTFELLSVKGKL